MPSTMNASHIVFSYVLHVVQITCLGSIFFSLLFMSGVLENFDKYDQFVCTSSITPIVDFLVLLDYRHGKVKKKCFYHDFFLVRYCDVALGVTN